MAESFVTLHLIYSMPYVQRTQRLGQKFPTMAAAVAKIEEISAAGGTDLMGSIIDEEGNVLRRF